MLLCLYCLCGHNATDILCSTHKTIKASWRCWLTSLTATTINGGPLILYHSKDGALAARTRVAFFAIYQCMQIKIGPWSAGRIDIVLQGSAPSIQCFLDGIDDCLV